MANYATSSLKLSDTYVNTLPYNTCSTAAGTAAKTVSAGTFSLETGAMVVVKFTATNTAANPTLNVSSTGAKAIYYNGAAITAGHLKANKVYQFIYNGTQWDLVGDVDTNTTYTFNGAVSTIKDSDLTANRALVSNNSGKIAVHPSVSSTEIGYLDGVTRNIQTQLDGKTKRVVLTGQCQTTSYRLSLIALCRAPIDASANPGNSYSAGRITFERQNNLYAPIILDVTMGGSHGAVGRIRCSYSTNAQFEILRPCTFTYNGIVYGGLAFKYQDAETRQIEFNGATSIDIFALDVYDTQTQTALNTDVYNSINYDNEIYVDHGLLVNGTDVLSGAKNNIKTTSETEQTIQASTTTPLYLDSNTKDVSYLGFKNAEKTFGYIGIDTSEQPVFYDTARRVMYHAGNYTSIPAATSSGKGLVKSGGDITVASDGTVSVNDDSHNHVISNVDGLQTALNGKVNIRDTSNASYTAVASFYGHSAAMKKYIRIVLPDNVSIYTMLNLEVSLRQSYADGTGGKVFINAYHNNTSQNWISFTSSTSGHLTDSIKVYGSDGKYFYIEGCATYSTISLDKILVGDSAVNSIDFSSTIIDSVDTLPTTYQTASMVYGINSSNISSQSVASAASCTGNAETATLATQAESLAMSRGNEINFVGNTTPTEIWFNYRDTTTGQQSGNTTPIQAYKFGNTNGTISGVTLYADNFSGNAATATTLKNLTATVTELNYVDGVTSNIQTQLNNKASLTQLNTDTLTAGSGTWHLYCGNASSVWD